MTSTDSAYAFTQLDLIDFLVTDAGISYWAEVRQIDAPTALTDTVLVLVDTEDEGARYTLTGNDVLRGLTLLIEQADVTYANPGYDENKVRLQRLLDTNATESDYDAIDADAVIQMAALGKVIYG